MAENKELAEYRSLGEAHLYVAIAKADGVVTMKERHSAPRYAKKSQQVFNVMKVNSAVEHSIKSNVIHLLSDERYALWDAERHLDEAVSLLKQAKKAGDWAVELSRHKNEEGLLQVAFLDGYTIKESQFLKKIQEKLAQI